MSGFPVAVSYARLQRALRLRGVRGTARAGVRLAQTRRARREWVRRDREFDIRHGVDTTGIVPLQALAIESSNRELGIRYQPSSPEGFRALIGDLAIPHDELTFIDLGAGKGRALLLASELPFRRVVGVEFAVELCEVARRNVERYRGAVRRCRDVEVVCADAAHWELPEEPALVYVYNAFEPPLMREVLTAVRRSVERRPRTLLLALVNRTIERSELAELGFRLRDAGEHGELYVPSEPGAP